jgi:hypothetical protein
MQTITGVCSMNDPSRASAEDEFDDHAASTEIDRQRRLVDQAMTMQSALRDWDRAFGTSLVCIVLVTALIGVAFAFAGGDQSVVILGVRAGRATWLGWLAVATFALTLIELVLDPRGAARRRADAVRALAVLKGEYRTAAPHGEVREVARRLSRRYEAVMVAIQLGWL